MAKKIRITEHQLEETINNLQLEAADNMTLELGGNSQDPVEKRVKDTMQNARANGVNVDKVDINVPNEVALNCSKILSKSQILEARRNYLRENSNHYTKSNFIKK